MDQPIIIMSVPSGRPTQTRTLLAISSGGGHWVQLMRLRSVFECYPVVYATVEGANRSDVSTAEFYTIPDGNIKTKLALVRMAIAVWILLRRVRPAVIVTTGAAPGYFALRFGKALGARTIWIDSIANAKKLSLSGRNVAPYADVWLTQWPELAQPEGPVYQGSVV